MTDVATPEAIIAVYPTGQVVVGAGYDLGTIIDALNHAVKAIRGVVLRPLDVTAGAGDAGR